MSLTRVSSGIGLLAAAFAAVLVLAPAAHAQQAKEIVITYKGQQFQPAQIGAPANTALRLRVKNSMPSRWSSRARRCGSRRW